MFVTCPACTRVLPRSMVPPPRACSFIAVVRTAVPGMRNLTTWEHHIFHKTYSSLGLLGTYLSETCLRYPTMLEQNTTRASDRPSYRTKTRDDKRGLRFLGNIKKFRCRYPEVSVQRTDSQKEKYSLHQLSCFSLEVWYCTPTANSETKHH